LKRLVINIDMVMAMSIAMAIANFMANALSIF
jgi:hypothetical protein